jgi:cytochrome c oxidase accessory protein FixG
MAFTTGLMMFDFCIFREQTCLVACPYGRLQSVLLDRNSLVVSYDPNRGEPRGKQRRRPEGGDVPLAVVAQPARGDCIDCHKCVTTCPTGIDIRQGLQMECIHCTQCIDACDEVMDKIGKPRGLIRYSSQAAIEGGRRQLLRPRVVIYPLLLLALLTILVTLLVTKPAAEITVIRASGGLPYFAMQTSAGDRVGARVKLRVRNRTEREVAYTFSIPDLPGAAIDQASGPMTVEGLGLGTAEIVVAAPPEIFGPNGRHDVAIRVDGSDGFHGEVTYRLLGPAWTGQPSGE